MDHRPAELMEIEKAKKSNNGNRPPEAENEEALELSFGSIVYAKFGKNPWWPARIDAVELNRSGKSEPDKYWPIYFFGEENIAWVERRFVKPFARSAIEEPFQAPEFVNRSIGSSLRNSKMAAYQKALLQVRTTPFHEFQFSMGPRNPESEKEFLNFLEGREYKADEVTQWDIAFPKIVEK